MRPLNLCEIKATEIIDRGIDSRHDLLKKSKVPGTNSRSVVNDRMARQVPNLGDNSKAVSYQLLAFSQSTLPTADSAVAAPAIRYSQVILLAFNCLILPR